jgi:hypothetical protein
MLNESLSSSASSSFAGVIGSAAADAVAVGTRGVDGDLVRTSSVPRKAAGESGAAPEDGEGKMEKDRSRCSSADDAPRVIPPRRGDGDCGCAREDRAKMAPTMMFTMTNHVAPEPSHAGRGQHHHSVAAIAGARR